MHEEKILDAATQLMLAKAPAAAATTPAAATLPPPSITGLPTQNTVNDNTTGPSTVKHDGGSVKRVLFEGVPAEEGDAADLNREDGAIGISTYNDNNNAPQIVHHEYPPYLSSPDSLSFFLDARTRREAASTPHREPSSPPFLQTYDRQNKSNHGKRRWRPLFGGDFASFDQPNRNKEGGELDD